MNPLKYLALSVLIMIFVFDLSFAEDKQYGFQDIPFGTSYDEFKEKLQAKYPDREIGNKQEKELIEARYPKEKKHRISRRSKRIEPKEEPKEEPTDSRMSEEEFDQKIAEVRGKDYHRYSYSNEFIILYDFRLGDKQVEVTFSFDHNGKFYRFQFETLRKTADLFSSSVYNDNEYLTDIFKNKYGKPAQCFTPRLIDIKTNYISYLCQWKHKDMDIYTGFTTYEFKYSAVGVVASKKLENEYNSYRKQQENKNAMDGAKKF